MNSMRPMDWANLYFRPTVDGSTHRILAKRFWHIMYRLYRSVNAAWILRLYAKLESTERGLDLPCCVRRSISFD
jgi:hypothetical protein